MEGVIQGGSMFDLADQLTELRENKAASEARVKTLNTQIEAVEKQLVDAMVDQEMQNFNRAGKLFYLTTQVYASAIPEKKDTLIRWLRAKGYKSLVQTGVNPKTLAAFIREQKAQTEEGNLPARLAECVKVYEKSTVAMRKASK